MSSSAWALVQPQAFSIRTCLPAASARRAYEGVLDLGSADDDALDGIVAKHIVNVVDPCDVLIVECGLAIGAEFEAGLVDAD